MKPKTLHISYHQDAVVRHQKTRYERRFIATKKGIRTQLCEPHHWRDRGPTAARPRSMHRIVGGNLFCVDSGIIVNFEIPQTTEATLIEHQISVRR
jgi:hypothetical protein